MIEFTGDAENFDGEIIKPKMDRHAGGKRNILGLPVAGTIRSLPPTQRNRIAQAELPHLSVAIPRMQQEREDRERDARVDVPLVAGRVGR